MNLLPAWRDSLTLFQPKNFKLFFLVTLKTMVDTFKVWIKYFWWIWALKIVYVAELLPIPYPAEFFIAHPLFYALIPSYHNIFLVTILLAARPSTALKNCAYFRSYFWRALLMIFLFSLADVIVTVIIMGPHLGAEATNVRAMSNYIFGSLEVVMTLLMIRSPEVSATFLLRRGAFFYEYAVLLTHVVIMWGTITYSLFLFDSDGSIKSFFKSWIHAVKMMLYNLPFYIIALVGLVIIPAYPYVFIGIDLLEPSHGLWYYFVGAVWGVLITLLSLFTICFLTNFYIKKLHDQFTLYFGKNE